MPRRLAPFTEPAIWIAPPNSSNFSVNVVLPASGWPDDGEGTAAVGFSRWSDMDWIGRSVNPAL